MAYGMMTGFGVSACRAIGMYLIHMLGEVWGRTYDMLTAMGVLAVVMLADNPLLSYHSGFLLSFSSVCAVGILPPLLKLPSEWFRRYPGEKQYIVLLKKLLQKTADGLSVSLGVTLFTLPIQLFFFYKVPIYSVFINLLVIPFMSVVMVVGIVIMLLPPLGFLGVIEVGIFQWFEFLCSIFEQLPGNTWGVGRPPIWKLWVYYVLILGVIFLGKRLDGVKRTIALSALVFFMGFRGRQELKITILDVGQGDCICVQTAQGECFLFDGGSSSRQMLGEKVIIPFLEYEGVQRIDAVFLSHGDVDHYSGVLQLLESEKIPIEMLYLPAVGAEKQADFEVVLAAAKEIPVQYVAKGERWESNNLTLTCLHPAKDFEGEGNMYSACYLLQVGDFSMLFTGDVEGMGEAELVSELQRRDIEEIQLLKVAHHGSKNATSQVFLDCLNPKLAVISCGRKNPYGHPHAETLKRLEEEHCKVFITAEMGAVTVVADDEIKVWGWLQEDW